MDSVHGAGKSPGTAAQVASDPTLMGPRIRPGSDFPDTSTGTHLVLYQARDGAVHLRWRIDAAHLAHVRAGFGDTDAHPLLRLHQTDAVGGERLVADVCFATDADAQNGYARYDGSDAVGRLRAEIGLASADGGWLLIARSNGLLAAGRADGRRLPVVSTALATATFADGAAAIGAAEPAAAAVSVEKTTEPLHLAPEFPLVEPLPSAPVASAQPAGGPGLAGGLDAGPRTGDGTGQGGPRSGLSGGAPRRADPSLGSAAGQTRKGHAMGAGPPGAAQAPEPPPGGVVPRLEVRRPPPPAAPALPSPSPTAGSGPLRACADGASLRAELVLHGSAPPHTLLDLGGHPYRVGTGGRFVLHVPIGEHQVIMRVLAALPQLPVARRDEETP